MALPRKDSVAAIAPYATWMALMWLLPATAASYAVRTAATLLSLLFPAYVLRPARRNATDPDANGKFRNFPKSAAIVSLLSGLFVAALWIAPEYSPFYREWFIFGPAPDPAMPGAAPSPYDPATCGWTLFWTRLAGSAFVIAPVEELFFRSYLYRRLQNADWRNVPHGRFDFAAFAWTVALFSLEHNRILAAAVAGAVYGAVYVRRGFWCAAVSHSVTNLVLGLYVLRFSAWSFW